MRAAQLFALIACGGFLLAALVAPRTWVVVKRRLLLAAAVFGGLSTVIGATS